MMFSQSRKFDFPPEFTIGGSIFLEGKQTLKIVGVHVQSDLRWDSQVNAMINKSMANIWILRHIKALGVDKVTLIKYWIAEGRVLLELACPVWHSGLTVSQFHSLERVQRGNMAAITSSWSTSYTQKLIDLNLYYTVIKESACSQTGSIISL